MRTSLNISNLHVKGVNYLNEAVRIGNQLRE